MPFFYFMIGVFTGVCLLAFLPLVFATLGLALVIATMIALPLVAACLVLFGIVATLPAVGYGLAIAALLVILWASERKRQPPPAPG